MLPRDKGGVVDPRLKVSKSTDLLAYIYTANSLTPFLVGVWDAQLARCRSFNPPVAH